MISRNKVIRTSKIYSSLILNRVLNRVLNVRSTFYNFIIRYFLYLRLASEEPKPEFSIYYFISLVNIIIYI